MTTSDNVDPIEIQKFEDMRAGGGILIANSSLCMRLIRFG